MKYNIEDIEIESCADGADTFASAKAVLVINGTKRKLATSLRVTAAQQRGATKPIDAEEAVAAKLGKLAQRKAKEAVA